MYKSAMKLLPITAVKVEGDKKLFEIDSALAFDDEWKGSKTSLSDHYPIATSDAPGGYFLASIPGNDKVSFW